jgi:hypothetical protein
MSRFKSGLLVVAVWGLVPVLPAHGYVDLAPTLARVIRESQTITLVEVERFNRERGAIILKKVHDLKGETANEPLKHEVIRARETTVDRSILEWAEPGRRGVVFVTARSVLVCLGESWYEVHTSGDGWWRLGAPRPDLPLAYYGNVSRLAEAIPLLIAGKSAVITTLPHGVDREGASFDLAMNRASLPGLVKVQRLRATLRMPDVALGVGANPAYVLGLGRADLEDLPGLRDKLRAADATTRAETATDIGSLGPAATAAADDLTKCLHDEAPLVRMATAAALLRVRPEGSAPLDILARGMASEDVVIRRHAARAAGLSGAAAAPLAGKLGALLNDSDLLVRRSALQAIATLGPAAQGALEPVMALLDQPDAAIDAADALGRIGPGARPACKRLVRLLSAEAATERWAAVRALAQIGGEEAQPAVTFLIAEMPKASEVDGYNILIYLSMLGPVAREALPALRNSRVRNPVLRQITTWAINPGSDLPWQSSIGDSDVAAFILESYIHEFGDHFPTVAQALVKKIMAGTAGNVPAWGYKLLARFPEESLAVLTPALSDNDRTRRERAVVTLGYMGRAAVAAKPQVKQALDKAKDEREQRLLKWCLREME